MEQHIVIRKEEYVAGTTEKPEVKVFTQSHVTRPPIPWGRIAIGDVVWLKWSGGPIVAKGLVRGFLQIASCTPEVLRNTVSGTDLFNRKLYWRSLPSDFFGMVIFIENEEWIVPPIFPTARSYGESWVILDSNEKQDAWLKNQGENIVFRSDVNGKRNIRRALRASERFEVLRRDNFTCRYCGRKAPSVRLQVDHVVPWSAGGGDNLSNLVTACEECNRGKSAKLLGDTRDD